jgi:hypothetical protein
MGTWALVATTLAGLELGELTDAHDRQISLPLNAKPAAGFRVRMDHRHADDLLGGEVLVKAYEDGTLREVFEVATAEEVADGSGIASVAVNLHSAGWARLERRLLGRGSDGYSQGTALVPVALHTIAQTILTTVNTSAASTVAAGTFTGTATGHVGPWHLKPVTEALQEMSATLDGFDFEIAPEEPTASLVGTLNVAATIGQSRTDTILEYGTGQHNIASYQRRVDLTGLANAAYIPGQSAVDGQLSPLITVEDAASITTWGRREAVVPTDLLVEDFRRKLAYEHVTVRKQPRQLITFTPTVDAFTYGVDFEVGDVIRARAAVAGDVRFDALFRIYGVTWQIDDEGRAEPAVTLSPENS